MKILIIFFLTGNFLFAQLPAFFNLNGYKNLKFGMEIEEADDKITNYNLILYADFFESIELNDKTLLNIYKNDKDETAYYLYFYDNYLYRIEICNHIGYSYNNPRFSFPAEKSKIDDIKEKLIGEFGEVSKTDIKYYTFYDKPFEEYILWWSSDLVSISLYIKPDLDTLDKTIKKYSYRISFYDEIKMKKMRKK
ncbi:hypothetical protein [Brachyspira sp.]|uniref:hypothetical protein n=1 Tax=Brachyspira sp. TaxID=1977261 RepID=UPI003D7D285D